MESLTRRLRARLGRFTLRIRSGPLRGLKWSVATGSRFLRGVYEPETTAALGKALSEGDVAFDVGAHVGYLTAVASRAVGETGSVYAFEPRPLNRETLERHLRINGLTNVTVLETGVASEAGIRRFAVDTGSGTGHLSEEGALEIRTVALDEEIGAGRLPAPDLIKVDVEGAEAEVLSGARATLRRHGPVLLVSTHGPEPYEAVIGILTEAGYRQERLTPETSSGHTELLARPRPAFRHERPSPRES